MSARSAFNRRNSFFISQLGEFRTDSYLSRPRCCFQKEEQGRRKMNCHFFWFCYYLFFFKSSYQQRLLASLTWEESVAGFWIFWPTPNQETAVVSGQESHNIHHSSYHNLSCPSQSKRWRWSAVDGSRAWSALCRVLHTSAFSDRSCSTYSTSLWLCPRLTSSGD